MATESRATNVVWHEGHVSRALREQRLGQRGVLVWLTGLPSSGKSTTAFTTEHALIERGDLAYVLDGDNIRHGLNKNLGFTHEDREENIRRIAEVGKLFADAGVITLTSFVSPYRVDRDNARALMAEGEFIEVYINTPLELCEERDPKGMYRKARTGEIPHFTGVSDPYEPPLEPELELLTADITPQEGANAIIGMLQERGVIPRH
ncbi:adenylyl-sulfate kinase [Candidatus Latescibacterota bacterium]